jgi:hypothetical protein
VSVSCVCCAQIVGKQGRGKAESHTFLAQPIQVAADYTTTSIWTVQSTSTPSPSPPTAVAIASQLPLLAAPSPSPGLVASMSHDWLTGPTPTAYHPTFC